MFPLQNMCMFGIIAYISKMQFAGSDKCLGFETQVSITGKWIETKAHGVTGVYGIAYKTWEVA